MGDREIAFWLLSKYCGNVLSDLYKINYSNKLERVCYEYVNKGCSSRSDYVFLVESFRIFQHLDKNNWIIDELLK